MPAPSLAERAFWWAIYQLEELEELRMLAPDDPMILFLEDGLDIIRPILLAGDDIPEGFWATRPHETDDSIAA
ncbi:MAG: hypothetical protein U5O39_10180 [Gammaproteobacteria bacterium]|nr:hypothetical protein [Gammaproteobacteria bacterium]